MTTAASEFRASGRSRRIVDALAAAWKQMRMLYRVLLLVRFNLLLGVIGGLVLLLNDQAQDVLRALGESPDARIGWFAVGVIGTAILAWWSARVMFYFRFRNPASRPDVFKTLKEHLPRALGAAALLLPSAALLKASLSYSPWLSAGSRALVVLSACFAAVAVLFVYVTMRRRVWLSIDERDRPSNLRSLAELERRAWVPLALTAVGGFVLMISIAYCAVWLGPLMGTAAVAFFAAIGLLPVGTLIVYLGNRRDLPVVTMVLLWAGCCTYLVDNHMVRLSAEATSHDAAAPDAPSGPPNADLGAYLESWLEARAPAAGDTVPLFIVAAEGGGIRAAYWTALVLGELEDRSGGAFSRYLFAISGVSGGSLGAAVFASLVANENAGLGPLDCASSSAAGTGTMRGRAQRVLERDFLAPTVAVMLFPDMLQQFIPIGFLNDRAVALETSWENAWSACEEGERFTRPIDSLYTPGEWNGTPLLFLNSTVVETGQRLVMAPVRIDEPTFSEALDGRAVLGPRVPLSTAVHNSARFTYVSPAGTVRRLDRTSADGSAEWIRLVDGGYFENSGAVTAAEILRAVRQRAETLADRARVRPVVIHISNDPETTAAEDLLERRKWLNQIVAPVKALYNARQARGFQARETLARDGVVHVHFRLCSHPNGAVSRKQPLPLGWTLSSLARQEMHRQLGLESDASEMRAIARLNRNNIDRVMALLAAPEASSADSNPWACPADEA